MLQGIAGRAARMKSPPDPLPLCGGRGVLDFPPAWVCGNLRPLNTNGPGRAIFGYASIGGLPTPASTSA